MIFNCKPMMNSWIYKRWIYEDMHILYNNHKWFGDPFERKYQCYYERCYHMVMIAKGISHLWILIGERFYHLCWIMLKKLFYVLILKDLDWHWSLDLLCYIYIDFYLLCLDLDLASRGIGDGGSNRIVFVATSSPKLRAIVGLS